MANKYHDTEAAGSVHIPHNFVYATSTARLAAVAGDFTSVDAGKLALQSSDNSLWRLDQISPCVKWRQISGKSETLNADDFYIDGMAGNDTTGNGSQLYPWKTFAPVFDLPEVIKHEIKIRVLAGTYSLESFVLHRRFEGEGRIVFDASAATYPVVEGPLTLAESLAVTDIGLDGKALAYDLRVAGASWTTDEFFGKFVHVLTGAWADYVLPIFKNTADKIRVPIDWYGFAPGDTFEIVNPPVALNVNGVFEISSDYRVDTFEYTDNFVDAVTKPVVYMAGFKVVANITRAHYSPFQLKNIDATFSFVALINADDTQGWNACRILGSVINNKKIAATFDNDKLDDDLVFPFVISAGNGALGLGSLVLWDSEIAQMVTRVPIGLFVSAVINYVMCEGIISENYWSAYSLYIESSTPLPAIWLFGEGFALLPFVWIENSAQQIQLDQQSKAEISWMKGPVTGTTGEYAVRLAAGARVIASPARTTLLGSIGATHLLFSDTKNAAWPVLGSVHSDLAGTLVVGESV